MVLAAAAGWKIADNKELSAEEAVQAFVGEMNRMAQELGFERSHFSNPDGWHTGSHYTCLNDMARIAKLALEEKTIARYMRMGEDEVTFLSGQTKEWKNTNLLVNTEEGFHRYDAIGMKTGYTRPAEYCLMSAFRLSDGRNLVVGVFGYADSYKRFNDVNKLVAACKEQFAEEAKEAKNNGTP
jgi:D-alanyl-D-alanine carboxypeptidase (penicillin-binding protein 5/6)